MRILIYTFLLFCICAYSATAQSNEIYMANANTLNMRSGTSINHNVVATLSKGDVVEVIDKTNQIWWYVIFEGKFGYVYSKLLIKDPNADWERKSYKSGVTPDCENVQPKYDYDLDNYLRVRVGSGTDVVIKLMEIGGVEDECIRIVYVRSGDVFEIKNIPEGLYYLKIAYGKDYRKKIVDNNCFVKFMKNAQYEKGTEILDFNKIKMPDKVVGDMVYTNWNVPSFELHLDVVVSKGTKPTFKANDISESEFNK